MTFVLGRLYSGNAQGVQLTIDGETEPTTKRYTFLGSYLPTAGDRVLIAEVGDEYIVIDKILTERAQGGRVYYAQVAGSTSSATNAQVAGTVNHVHNWIITTAPTTSTDAGVEFRTDASYPPNATKLQWRAVSSSTKGSWHDL